MKTSASSGSPATLLVDGKGLDGNIRGGGHTLYEACAHTGSGGAQWYSLELAVPQKVTRVQIVPRLDCCPDRNYDISITVGPSESFDPNEPECLHISKLVLEEGFVDYFCTGTLHEGKYVKISKNGILALCEVKVFTLLD